RLPGGRDSLAQAAGEVARRAPERFVDMTTAALRAAFVVPERGRHAFYVTLAPPLFGKACVRGHRVRNGLDVLLENRKGAGWHAHLRGACEPGGASPQLHPRRSRPRAWPH